MALSITTSQDQGVTRLVVAGEVDVSNASELRDILASEFAAGVSAIAVDISAVSYIDSTGIGVLVASAHDAQEADVSFTVLNPQHNVARVLTMLDLNDRLGVIEEDSATANDAGGIDTE